MEPIYEEELDYGCRQSESKSVQREVFRSEKVESSRRILPQETVMAMEARYYSPEDLGPPEMSSLSYSYTYEKSYDPPASPLTSPCRSNGGDQLLTEQNGFYNQDTANDPQTVERHTSQTEKVTRVTRVVTTRTVQQIPLENEDSEYAYQDQSGRSDTQLDQQYNDVDYSPYVTDDVQPNSVPSAPGVPQVVDIDSTMVTLSWLRPDHDGEYGPLLGYQVQYRRIGDSVWHFASPHIINEPRYTVYALEENGLYEFRTIAKNAAGYGNPSTASPAVQLRPKYTQIGKNRRGYESGVPFPPGRPQVVNIDSSSATLVWEPPIDSGNGGPVAGYQIQYRPSNSTDWLLANDYLVTETTFNVHGLRPNGEYEFRIFAKNADGLSEPSRSSGVVRILPAGATRGANATPTSANAPSPPAQPYVTDVDEDMVTLIWAPPPCNRGEATAKTLTYILEFRETSDPNWYSASDRPIQGTQFTIMRLKPNSTYEFRVFARNSDGISEPSEISDIVQLRPKLYGRFGAKGPPPQPTPPEVMEVFGNNAVICWAPVQSNPPVQGYEVEFQDMTENPNTWFKVTEILIKTCKMTIGDLAPNHDYVFRVVAKNAINYSDPSVPGTVITVDAGGGCMRLTGEPSRYETTLPVLTRDPSIVSESGVPLPVEISEARESPPITDTDDSPPPIRRHPTSGTDKVQYRDPTLAEVLEYLTNRNHIMRLNSSGYLQHLTYHDDLTKHRVRELNGIPKIIDLLSSDMPEIQKNACGCLRNLSYGIDENKRAILMAGGVTALGTLLRKTPDMQVVEEITGVLWNLSSGDELKVPVLQYAVEPLIKQIIIPYSGWSPSGQCTEHVAHPTAVFRNATGVLRNISSSTDLSRQTLRDKEGLVDSLVYYLHAACARQEYDTKAVENVVCILRNLSYRLQEIEDPGYDRMPLPHERSKSAPSGSPKVKTKKDKTSKKKGKDGGIDNLQKIQHVTSGVGLLWKPDIVIDYIKLFESSTNPDTLEASAGAIQNLAACYWQPSIDIRAAVRKEKGLPTLVTLLGMECDKVVCAVAAALRNLAMDERNKALIGKYAMEDLVQKLPSAQHPRPNNVSDDTIAVILSVIYVTTFQNPNFARTFHEKGGVERLKYISRSSDFDQRVIRYVSLVLDSLWRHRELQDTFKRAGYQESDFLLQASGGGRGAADTLARPVSTRGIERGRGTQSRVRPDWNDDYSRRSPAEPMPASSVYGGSQPKLSTTPKLPSAVNHGSSPAQSVRAAEPLYAQVQKKKGGNNQTVPSETTPQESAYDSWV